MPPAGVTVLTCLLALELVFESIAELHSIFLGDSGRGGVKGSGKLKRVSAAAAVKSAKLLL